MHKCKSDNMYVLRCLSWNTNQKKITIAKVTQSIMLFLHLFKSIKVFSSSFSFSSVFKLEVGT